MSSLDEFPALKVGVRATQLIVIALFLGVALFLAITSFLLANGRIEVVEPALLTWVFLGMGVVLLPAVAFVRGRILAAARRAVLAGEGPREQGGAGAALAEAGAAGRLFQGWQTATIVMAAGLEGVALACTVGALIEGRIEGLVAAGFFALLLLAFVPTTGRFEQWLEGELAEVGLARDRSD